jgi:hypothetical protein
MSAAYYYELCAYCSLPIDPPRHQSDSAKLEALPRHLHCEIMAGHAVNRLSFVVGASGSGKTSFCRAALRNAFVFHTDAYYFPDPSPQQQDYENPSSIDMNKLLTEVANAMCNKFPVRFFYTMKGAREGEMVSNYTIANLSSNQREVKNIVVEGIFSVDALFALQRVFMTPGGGHIILMYPHNQIEPCGLCGQVFPSHAVPAAKKTKYYYDRIKGLGLPFRVQFVCDPNFKIKNSLAKKRRASSSCSSATDD